MGIDVEFSATRPTTGIAGLEGDHLTLERAGTAWKSREAQIPSGLHPSVITINGPLLPLGADLHMRRHVEPLFICAPFHITVGDPALVVIIAWDWICERHPFQLPATNGIPVPFRSCCLALAPGSCFRHGITPSVAR